MINRTSLLDSIRTRVGMVVSVCQSKENTTYDVIGGLYDDRLARMIIDDDVHTAQEGVIEIVRTERPYETVRLSRSDTNEVRTSNQWCNRFTIGCMYTNRVTNMRENLVMSHRDQDKLAEV